MASVNLSSSPKQVNTSGTVIPVLSISIPELYPPQDFVHTSRKKSTSEPSSRIRTEQHSPAVAPLACLPFPPSYSHFPTKSPKLSGSSTPSPSPFAVAGSTESRSSVLITSPEVVNDNSVRSWSPPTPAEPPSPSVASLVDLVIRTPSKTDLMADDLHIPSPNYPSPLPPSGPSVPLAKKPSPLRNVSEKSADSPEPSPPSAVALSSPGLPAVLLPRVPSGESATPSGPSISSNRQDGQGRHSTFYLRDEMVVLDVQRCLYRVHRHLLERNSDFFRRLLCAHAGDNTKMLGSSDETAFVLPDIQQSQLDCLLNYLYYKIFDDDVLPLSEWIALLDVSTHLRFVKIRATAIREITANRETLSAVEIIVLAIRHNVPAWLEQAYFDLCRRPHPLDDLEAEQLGARTTARVARARETIRDEACRLSQQDQYGSRGDAYDDQLVSRVVSEVFSA